MTIKEFSELLDVSIDTVTRAAKSIFPNRFSQGKAAVFNVAESKQIIAAIKHKGILTQNAEAHPQNAEVAKAVDAQSIVALLRTAADEIDKRDKQIAVLEPKAEIHDQIAEAGNAKTVAQVAQVLGTGQKRLFKFMRDSGILNEHNRPYQEHVDAKRLIVRETTVRIGEQIVTHPQVFITGKGELWLAGLMNPVASRLLQ